MKQNTNAGTRIVYRSTAHILSTKVKNAMRERGIGTMDELATIAGLGIGTISRLLNGQKPLRDHDPRRLLTLRRLEVALRKSPGFLAPPPPVLPADAALHERIRAARMSLGWSQTELGERVPWPRNETAAPTPLSQETISRAENEADFAANRPWLNDLLTALGLSL